MGRILIIVWQKPGNCFESLATSEQSPGSQAEESPTTLGTPPVQSLLLVRRRLLCSVCHCTSSDGLRDEIASPILYSFILRTLCSTYMDVRMFTLAWLIIKQIVCTCEARSTASRELDWVWPSIRKNHNERASTVRSYLTFIKACRCQDWQLRCVKWQFLHPACSTFFLFHIVSSHIPGVHVH